MAEVGEAKDGNQVRRIPLWPFVLGGVCFLLLALGVAAFVIFLFSERKQALRESRVAKARMDETSIHVGVGMFRVLRGRFPSSLDELRTPQKDFEEGLLDVGNDPWGRPYEYSPGPGPGFTIRSLGADGLKGGQGEDEDIVFTDPGTPSPAKSK